jgi:pimeloyl-ACP methyl ester carboxylesterase
MMVVLVHGIGRTPLSMRRLARELRRAGHTVGQFGYAAALESLTEIAVRLRRELESWSRPGEPMVVVGHSLGALLLRLAMAIEPPMAHQPRHLVMLGPPNQSPRLARRLRRFWPYRLFNGDAGQRLADPAYLAALPMPTVPYTILAGVNGRRGRWSAFGDEPNDGLVALSETRCGADDLVIEVPARHTFLMNHRLVRRTIGTIIHELAPS